jgi:hypothetical protein
MGLQSHQRTIGKSQKLFQHHFKKACLGANDTSRPLRIPSPLGGERVRVRGGRFCQEPNNFIYPPRAHHQFMPDLKTDGLQFTPHLMIPKAQHLDAFVGEELIPLFIPRPLIGKTMPPPSSSTASFAATQ